MKARFKVETSGSDEEANWTASGFDHVQYLISANPGEPLGPVEEIASGGELSRVMLALKTSVEAGSGRTLASQRRRTKLRTHRTLVFDEIDSGIGGRAAEAVGKKLKQLSRTDAGVVRDPPAADCVLCRPALTSSRSAKSPARTKTSVRALDTRERTDELARMMSGAKLTETSLKHAEQMLKANR